MRVFLVLAVLAMALPAVAFDLGARAPAKPYGTHQPPPADPDLIRQGGDTMADAPLLTIPAANATGTTNGFTDDYDEACPYSNSTSPDVVYRLAPQAGIIVDIDMLGSAYDTKIYVYREDLTLVACNDDFHPDYVSKIEQLSLAGSAKYFLVIDGYGGDAGDYLLNIDEYVPCELECPYGFELESEPPLHNDYVDDYNGGCNTDTIDPPLQALPGPYVCGVTGWYLFQGGQMRDTDWFTTLMPPYNPLEIHIYAEEPTYLCELGPLDCGGVGVVQSIVADHCQDELMVIHGQAGADVWIWVGPSTFSAPPGFDVYEYDYLIEIRWPYDPPVVTETHNWSSVKSLFR